MLRAITLRPANELAWRLYWEARLPGNLGELLFRLRTLRLTEAEAAHLAHRIAHLAGEQAQIEYERQKRADEEAKNSR